MRRLGVTVAVAMALVIAVPVGLPAPASGPRFPLSGLWELLSARPGWAVDRPVTPRQGYGSAVRTARVDADSTRANGGSGRAPDKVAGDYSLPGEMAGVQTTSGGKGFDAATSRRIPGAATATSDVFENADGTFTRMFSPGPRNYRAGDGSWQPIDTDLVSESSGRVRVAADSVAVSFAGRQEGRLARGAGDGTVGDMAGELAALMLPSGQRFAYRLAGARGVEPVVAGPVATYHEILPGTDVQLTTVGGGWKETIVVHSAAAATEWVFPLVLHGLTARIEPDGSVALYDAQGAVVASIPRGFMEDSKNNGSGDGAWSDAVRYELTIVDGGPALKVVADRAWITDPARVFPVRVDPTLIAPGAASTYAQEPHTNNNSGSLYLKTGYHSSGPYKTQSYVKFYDFSSTYLGNKISSAKVNVHVMWSGSCPSTRSSELQVWDTAGWDPAGLQSWPQRPTMYSQLGALTAVPNTTVCGNSAKNPEVGQWWGIPLTDWGVSILNRWTSGGVNNGLSIATTLANNDTWKYLSSVHTTKKPTLEVTYAPNAAPLIEAQYPEHGHAAVTLTPELMVRGADSDAWPAGLTYKFFVKQVEGEQVTDVADSGGYSAATTWQVPPGKLVWGKTYVWTVLAWDGMASSSNQSWKVLSTSVPQPPITSGLSQNGDQGFAPNIGNYTTTVTDAMVASPGPAVAIARSYNSRDPRTGAMFGAGWSTVLDAKVTENTHTVVITYPSGQEVAFGRNGDGVTFAAPAGRYAELAKVTGGYQLSDKDGTKYAFTQSVAVAGGAPTWRLTSITDTNGRALTLAYDGAGVPTSLTGASGRALTFTTVGGRVTEVRNGAGEKWAYTYTGATLSKVCPPTSATACTVYSYAPTWSHPTTVQDGGPHTYWRLGEPAGASSAASAVTNDLDTAIGQYHNVTLGQPGVLAQAGTAAGFNGTSSQIEVPPKVALTAAHQSVSMWFKTTTAGVLLSYQQDALSGPASPTGWVVPSLYVGTDGKLRGEFWNGAAAPMVSPNSVTDGVWHHVVLTAAGITQTMYVDGTATADSPKTGTVVPAPGPMYQHVGAGFINGWWPASPVTSTTASAVSYFTGSITDVAFYTRPLQTSQVALMHGSGKTASNSLTRITRPSGGITAQVEYQPGSDVVSKVIDANNGVWTIGSPQVAGSAMPYTSAVMAAAPADYFRMVSSGNEVNGITATASGVTFGSTDGPIGAKAASFNGTSSTMTGSGPSVDTSGSYSVSAAARVL